jgi:hypothetical protein
MLDPSRAAELVVEQRRRVGAAAVGKLVSANPDEPEAGFPVGLRGKQACGDLIKRIRQLGRIIYLARTRSQPKIGGLELSAIGISPCWTGSRPRPDRPPEP